MAFDDSILDIAYDAIFTLDARTSSITSWNGGAEVMYGYTRDEALGRPAGELLRSRFRTTRAQVMWELDATGRWEGDIVQTSKAGAEITVAARWALRRGGAGEPDVILEVNRNVTAERELARRFQLLVDSVREYAIFLLDPDGRVASWNTGAERMKGYAPDEIIGRDVSVFYTPEDRASGVPERAMGAAAAEGQHSQEVQCLRRDGSRFWATEVLTPLRDASGRVTAFAKVVRDDTGKRLEMERLHELDRAKTNLMNLAAHELRGPLTLISGYLAMLDEGTFGELDGRLRGALPALRARTAR